MKTAILNISPRTARNLTVLCAVLLLVGLVAVTVVKSLEPPKSKTTISKATDRKSEESKVASLNSAGLHQPKERIIPDSAKITLDQAKQDTSVKFLVPKTLPSNAKLEMVFRVPPQSNLDKGTISQRYDVNGKYLEIWATSRALTPEEYKVDAERYAKDGLKYVTVNGLPGSATEPNKVDSIVEGRVINNPGTLTWTANRTQYTIWGLDMPVSELMKIAESM